MRCPEGTHPFVHVAAPENTGNRMNCDDFKRFLLAQCRQDRRHSAREHCLPGTGRTNQKNIMSTGSCNLECALGSLLPDDIGEISSIACYCRRNANLAG
jgi:hypothetical protein